MAVAVMAVLPRLVQTEHLAALDETTAFNAGQHFGADLESAAHRGALEFARAVARESLADAARRFAARHR